MNEVSVSLWCVLLNGNIEKWVEEKNADIVRMAVKRGDKFIEIGGELINTFSVVGVFSPATMADRFRARNGEWKCRHGEWWTKNDRTCECDRYKKQTDHAVIAEKVREQYGITD